MSSPNPASVTHQRDWWVTLGITVSALSALVSSFSGLRSLALLAGWNYYLAIMLPLTVDAYAMTATRVWLSGAALSVRARRFARSNAIGAILLSLAGNGVDHLIAAHLLATSWVVVVVVGAVPPMVLGLVTHLAVLRKQVEVPAATTVVAPVEAVAASAEPAVSTGPVTAATPTPAVPAVAASTKPQSTVRTPSRTAAELLELARGADAAWRAAHDGRPINRDELRKALRVGGARASSALRQLRASANSQ